MSIEQEARLRAKTQEIAQHLQSMMPPGVGFTLFLFTFGENGYFSYLSSADRETMISAVKEWLARVEGKGTA